MEAEGPLIYEPQTLTSGLVIRYDTNSIIEQIMRGREVYLTRKDRYSILYRAFERYKKRHPKKVGAKRIALTQVNHEKWKIVLMSGKSKKRPTPQLEEGFSRVHGRYRTWAIELNENTSWQSKDFAETQKVMAAWRYYIPKAERKNKGLLRRKIGDTYSIFVIPKAG